MSVTEKQQQKIDGLLRYVREYLSARFDHACRINPILRRVADELMWQQLATVRQIVSELKSFGPERYMVIDILVSFDARKKGALFSLTDQNTIFNEIVSEVGREKAQKKMEGVTINDIGSFYKTIDPSIENAVLLIQSWIWWDLPDALDLYMLDHQLEHVKALVHTEMTFELLAHYRAEMNNPSADLKISDIVAFELKRAHEVASGFISRRRSEPGFKMIVKRDSMPDGAIEFVIMTLAQRLRIIDQVQKNPALDPTLKEHYVKTMRMDPESLTPERVMAIEREGFNVGKQQLRRMLENETALGEPYDFKLRQVELVKEKFGLIESAATPAISQPA